LHFRESRVVPWNASASSEVQFRTELRWRSEYRLHVDLEPPLCGAAYRATFAT